VGTIPSRSPTKQAEMVTLIYGNKYVLQQQKTIVIMSSPKALKKLFVESYLQDDIFLWGNSCSSQDLAKKLCRVWVIQDTFFWHDLIWVIFLFQ
jgi:hypothetical protein